MQEDQRVAEMAVDVLERQAKAFARLTGGPFEDALKAVLETVAGRQLQDLRDGPHHDERADRWQEGLPRKRARYRERERVRERSRARLAAAWKPFIRVELLELELRKEGQLARMLGEPLPGEPPATLRRLAADDRRQAEAGLLALTSNGKTAYKHIDELCEQDMPARIAANRLRTTWLKERRDGWLGRREEDTEGSL